MKKALSFALSVLILLSTVWVGLTGITVAAESSTPIVDLNDAAVWVPNPNKPTMAVSLVTEDEYIALKASSADYQSMYVEVELDTSTNYSLLFDFKSSLKIENIQIWPTKCSPVSSSDGSVTYDKENYTTADRIVFLGGWDGATNFSSQMGHTDPTVWYNGNAVDFTTNNTDTSYRIFFKLNGVVNSELSTAKTFIFKNAYVKEKVTAEAVVKGNGIASVTPAEGYYGDTAVYSATPNEGEEFLGWYNGDVLVSNSATYSTTLVSPTNSLVAKFSTNNLMNIALWGESPSRASIQITEATVDGFDTIKVYDIQYAYFYVNMELKPNTTYKLSYDYKTDYKPEYVDVWSAKCGAQPKGDGNVGPGDGYTDNDKILRKYISSTDLDNAVWYENNVVEFTTNATDTSYQFFMKFGGFVNEDAKTTKSVYFKNLKVSEPVSATANVFGNGIASVTPAEGYYGDTAVYSATPNEGEEFLGWYDGDTLVSNSATYSTTLVSGTNSLVAKFSTNNLMNIACWGESPSRASIQITEATVDDFNAIKVYDIQYAYFYVNMELKPNTTYKLSYDYKTDYKPEYVDIWAAKCKAKPLGDGNVGPGDGYTANDKILRKYISSTDLDNAVWYENNVVEFTTNATDTSYQFFMKFGGFVNEDAKTTKSVYFKNLKVSEPVSATANTFGNGTATVSATDGTLGQALTYYATANEGEEFLGWYDKDYNLVSNNAEHQTTFAAGNNILTAYFTTKDNMNLSSWSPAPHRTDSKIALSTENDEKVITVSSVQWNTFFLDANLMPNTEYKLSFDYKSTVMLQNIQVWPIRTGATTDGNGNVTYNKESYTEADRILFSGGYDDKINFSTKVGHTAPDVWCEGNNVYFTTNSTDTAYLIIFKMNTWVDSAVTSPNAIYFKNLSLTASLFNKDIKVIGEDVNGNILPDSSEFATAETFIESNEDGTLTAKVTYSNDLGLTIFKGWYNGDTFLSGEEIYTFDPATVNTESLVAKFVSRNLLISAGTFENIGAETNMRVSPVASGILPENGKWGMWSQPEWATNSEIEGGYECETSNGSMTAVTTQLGVRYYSDLKYDYDTEAYTYTTESINVTPYSGNKMLKISAPYRSAVRKIENLKPNTNYTLSFYVYNTDRWNCLRTVAIADSTELETYSVKSSETCKIYEFWSGMNPAKFVKDTGLDEEYPVREWQQLTFNFTTDESTTELYLHLSLARNLADSTTTGSIYIDDLICYENVFENAGNAIRAKDSALRYKYSIKNEYLAGYCEGVTMSKVGLIATPANKAQGELTVDGDYILKDVNEVNYQYVDGDTANTYFTAALYNIGLKNNRIDYNVYGEDFSVRPYVEYQRADGSKFILYGDTVTANIFDVMFTIKYSAVNESDMAIVDAMLENEELYNTYLAYQNRNFFYIDKSKATDYAYSMAVVGDIQTTNYYYRDKLHCPFDWILNNAEDKKIEYVFGLGDITDMSTDEEFIAAKEQFLRLEDAGIKQSIIRGNHDWNYDKYITHDDFGEGLVSYDGTMRSYYRLTTIGGTKYMMLSIDLFPGDEVIGWAAEAIEAHPDYNVILTTHGYFDGGMTNGNGELLQDEDIQWVDDPANANSGQDIFDKLVNKYSNIVLVMCGHEIPVDHGPAYNVTTREDGSSVVQMMINHQHLEYFDKQSYGMLAMLYFSEDGKNVQLEYFSTVNGMFYMEKFQYEFTLDIK